MNEMIEKENINIEEVIYEIRGVEVMLDSDIAKLYKCKNGTKEINQAVKNNPEKFPNRFAFRLTNSEIESLKSKILTSKGGSRKGHTVFTEQGIYMLATILKTPPATKVTIAIMDTFVKMRHYINYNKTLLPHKFMLLEKQVDENTEKINELFDKFDPKDIVKDYIFFEGDFYDAYSTFIDILNKSRNEIILVDNYAGKELLDMLKDIDRNIIIISKNIDEIAKKKYEIQYKNVKFIHNETIHDRFIILDKYRLFVCGASFKDIGKKCFTINEINGWNILDELLKILHLKD